MLTLHYYNKCYIKFFSFIIDLLTNLEYNRYLLCIGRYIIKINDGICNDIDISEKAPLKNGNWLQVLNRYGELRFI